MHALPNGLERKSGTVTFALVPLGDIGALERQWRALDAVGSHSFFASWTWVSALLKNARGMTLLTASRGGSLAGMAVCRRARWPGRVWFNASGERVVDGVMVEHNNFALPGGDDPRLWADLLSWFAADGLQANELIVPGTTAAPAVSNGLIVVEDCRKAFRTPLDRLGSDGIAPLLSRNARQQLRRSLRDFGGELRLDVAPGPATALDWFGQLKALHICSWSRRGRRHAFTNPAFEPFHRAVISAGAGDVDLLRITAGDRVLGYLYNFKRNGVVHSYQSGFADADPGLRPGYVCHALAIGHYARTGMAVYDFLAGTNRLKQSFGFDSYDMVWRRYRRPSLAYRLERIVRERIITPKPAAAEH